MPIRHPGAGDLNRRVTLRLRTDFPAAGGDLGSEFSEQRSRWAHIEPVGSVVYSAGVQADNIVTHRITLRYLPGITDAHEVVHGQTVYRVRRVTDLGGAGRFTQLEVEEL